MMKSCLLWLNVCADLLRFLVLSFRSESALAAENLFLRKQLAFYRLESSDFSSESCSLSCCCC